MALRHLKKGESQLNSGLYNDALESLTIAENHARKGLAPDVSSIILGTIGNLLKSKGKYDEEEEKEMTKRKMYKMYERKTKLRHTKKEEEPVVEESVHKAAKDPKKLK